jgi:hypothetical protein
MRKRRYEILLPLKHNDGSPIPDELLEQTREEIVNQFDGVTFFPQTIIGTWVQAGARFEDELVRILVEVEESPENHQFFVDFKKTLLDDSDSLKSTLPFIPWISCNESRLIALEALWTFSLRLVAGSNLFRWMPWFANRR